MKHVPAAGTPARVSRRQMRDPGSAPSREKAYAILRTREAA